MAELKPNMWLAFYYAFGLALVIIFPLHKIWSQVLCLMIGGFLGGAFVLQSKKNKAKWLDLHCGNCSKPLTFKQWLGFGQGTPVGYCSRICLEAQEKLNAIRWQKQMEELKKQHDAKIEEAMKQNKAYKEVMKK